MSRCLPSVCFLIFFMTIAAVPATRAFASDSVNSSNNSSEALSYKDEAATNQLSLTLSANQISTKAYNGFAPAPSLEWEHTLAHSRFSGLGVFSPTINPNATLLGLSLGFGLSYRILGQEGLTRSYQDGDHILLKSQSIRSHFQLCTEAFLQSFQVYGTTSTVTFTGPTLGVKIVVDWFTRLSFGVRYAALVSGKNQANILATYVGYVLSF